MTVVVTLCCAVAAEAQTTAPSVPGDSTAPARSLAGLWKAERRFGPDARGTLIIKRAGSAYTADMMGRTLPVRVKSGELAFELPDSQGGFRGGLPSRGTLTGHWFPPGSSALLVGFRFASPVTLKADGPNRWRGQIVPFDDEFTFHLLLRGRPDGTLHVLLRNPERDFGAQIGAERLVRNGDVVWLMGRRRGQGEEQELAKGSYDAETDVLTLAFPSRGGSYDFRRDREDSDFYPRGLHPDRYVYRPPPALADGWPTGTLAAVRIDRAAIEKIIDTIVSMPMDSIDAPQIHGLLLARHGKLVLEEYFHRQHRDRLHETRSAAKSMTATLVGAAMQSGAPLALSTPVYRLMNGGTFPPGLDPRRRAMALEHLLTMSSGYFCDDRNDDAPGNENTMLEQTKEPDYYRYTLAVPMAAAPGTESVYCSANPNLALGMLGRATGESPLTTFDRLLGVPMRIRNYGWPLDPAGNPYGGGSTQFLPRDFMKFGQLMLNGGTWNSRRILGRDFVARASSTLVRIGARGYGYLWWGVDYPLRGRTIHAYSALGAGGQLVMVVPELDLVIASYGGSYSSQGWKYLQQDLIPRLVLPAVH